MTRAVADARSFEDFELFAEELRTRLPALFLRQYPSVRIERLNAAARWRDEGAIFTVEHEGVEYVPRFQFRARRPHPTIRAVLAAFPAGLTAWDQADWFVSSAPEIGGRRPFKALDEVDALVASARREGAAIITRRRQIKHNLELHAQAGSMSRGAPALRRVGADAGGAATCLNDGDRR